jgi:Lon protease-like protein
MPFLPLFPLNLVAYPGELLNLHIFEPRYRQLIGECIEDDSTFGIPVYMNNGLPGYGTEMVVSELVERYDDGRLDIRTRGIRVFRIVHFQNPAPGRLYAQGEVQLYAEPETGLSVMPELQLAVERLYALLNMRPEKHAGHMQPFSYQIAHQVGLPIEGEYELLTLEAEAERQAFILDHLNQTLPVLEDMERTKERIRMNGHFREFGEIKF